MRDLVGCLLMLAAPLEGARTALHWCRETVQQYLAGINPVVTCWKFCLMIKIFFSHKFCWAIWQKRCVCDFSLIRSIFTLLRHLQGVSQEFFCFCLCSGPSRSRSRSKSRGRSSSRSNSRSSKSSGSYSRSRSRSCSRSRSYSRSQSR